MVSGKQKLVKKREALRYFLLVLLAGGFMSGVFITVASAKQPAFSYPQLIEETILRIKQTHGLQCIYQGIDSVALTGSGLIFEEADSSDYKRLYEYIRLFDEEIQKYPPGFFKKEALKEIYFVKKLFHKEDDAEGLYDYRKKVIFFDFANQRGGGVMTRHNIHHEIFHVLDTNTFYWKDIDWEDLNEPDFKYIKTGKVLIDGQKNAENYFAPQRKGFVTYYAMKSAYEDKAEVYACLFVKSQFRLMHEWASKDPILAKKIQYVKRFLHEYSDGQVNDQYFTRLWQRFKK